MRIYSMTATFGKLERRTLTLEPGLNVIHAPNEWGKSTWCAFLVCMLYGIATKDRTTQTVLADKEHYAPWSGSPMSGRIELEWNGRDITIERNTKGKSVFNEFKAYETATGLPVTELTAANCGEVLLGVEKSVFTKSAFIRMPDLPVSDSEALRRRLNALVTTGDESSAGDALEQKLKDLRNRCRHNKTGLLPQAEAERDQITQKLQQLQLLQEQAARITDELSKLDTRIQLLENHRVALAYEASQANAQRVAAAEEACIQAENTYRQQEAQCDSLPSPEVAQEQILHLDQLRMQQDALREEPLPIPPQKPEVPTIFTGMTPEQAVQHARDDHSAYQMLSKPLSPVLWILACVCLAAGAVLAFLFWPAAIPTALIGAFCLILHFRNKAAQTRDREALLARYPNITPDNWTVAAQAYLDASAEFEKQDAAYKAQCNDRQIREAQLRESIAQATGGCSLSECLDGWRETLEIHEELPRTRQAYEQAKAHAQALADMLQPVPAPSFPDELTYSEQETLRQLEDARSQRLHLERQHSSCLGQTQAFGQKEHLLQQQEAIQARITRLEETYNALTLALETLSQTEKELQRKFAPKISNRAQALFSQLTAGRYDRLTLTESLQIESGAQDENNLHTILWRSDGTADQLYLALRLAVAEELTPVAPLILDDALVRFDDMRMSAAMSILAEAAENRQVILFSCQSRESDWKSSH